MNGMVMVLLAAGLLLALATRINAAEDAEKKAPASAEPLFKDGFDKDLSNWVIEKWEDDAVQSKLEDGQLRVTTNSKVHGAMIWCKQELPADFVCEYDFTPHSKSGFFLIFFSYKGMKGEDILSDEQLNDKNHGTLFKKYTMGRNGYHISYRRNESATCNLRRNAGQVLVKQEQLDALLPAEKKVHIKLSKKGGHIKLEVGGQVFMDHEDKETPWTGGKIGLRQVYESDGSYDNFTITELKD